MERVLQVLFPRRCFVCSEPTDGRALCDACVGELPPADDPACSLCALPVAGGGVCGRCQSHPPAFDGTVSAWPYRFPVDEVIQAFKYGERLGLAEFLVDALSARIACASEGNRVDLVLPMPLHPVRLSQRGFNQAAEIARPLARRLKLPLALQALHRVRDTPTQAGLSLKARRLNIRRAFLCSQDLSGLTVAVVDDVMTTGATLSEAAAELKRAGATRVFNWVVARTPPPD